jgi:aspartate aminotransferase
MTTTEKTKMISEKAAAIESSITLAITALSKKMKQDGIKVLSFSAGEPDFETPKNIQEVGINAIKEGKTGYTAASGILELKKSICAKLKRDNDLDYNPENIVISCGAKHAIFNSLAAILNPGDEVIIPTPYWVSYPHQVRLAGGTPVYAETDASTGFKITKQHLEQVITSKTKALFLTTPSNPTGAVYSKAELEDLVDIIVKNNIVVISDEIYEKLIYGTGKHVSIAALSEEMKNLTVLINGVSKAYSMTGWRIGYSATNVEIAQAINKIQGHMTSNPNTPAQWASIEAIDNTESKVMEMKQEFDKRRVCMVDGLNKIDGLTCSEPQGAFYAFPDISSFFGKKCKSGQIMNSADFCKYLLQEVHVACVPGSGFGSEGFIRLSYATSMEAIKEGLSRLEDWIKSLN